MILVCFGTRPEYLKVKSIIKEFGNKCKILFTGQHPDLLKEIECDYKIQILNFGKNRLDNILSSCMTQFPDGDFDGVIIQGDTASAFGCALAAFHRKIKIYYVEAGLRSYDLENPYPEEAYRQMITRIADYNFAPTQDSLENLMKENISGEVKVVGNTVLDNLVDIVNDAIYGNEILITLHRNENLSIMQDWFTELNDLAKDNPELKFILPIHPNPEIRKHKHLLSHVNVIEPLSHANLIEHIRRCKFIISDSGGLQEEGSFFNKRIIVCRKTTERPEGLKTNHLKLCESPNNLKQLFYDFLENYKINKKCPYGDGYSAKKIKKIIYK
jgi:UDP-N-acetylglucosamine 2-epimerase (non-hydrolysing)